jgi:hypothetical protein
VVTKRPAAAESLLPPPKTGAQIKKNGKRQTKLHHAFFILFLSPFESRDKYIYYTYAAAASLEFNPSPTMPEPVPKPGWLLLD